jgi:hypothetical protein
MTELTCVNDATWLATPRLLLVSIPDTGLVE